MVVGLAPARQSAARRVSRAMTQASCRRKGGRARRGAERVGWKKRLAVLWANPPTARPNSRARERGAGPSEWWQPWRELWGEESGRNESRTSCGDVTEFFFSSLVLLLLTPSLFSPVINLFPIIMPPAKLLALAALATLASAAPSAPRARVLALTERVGELRASYSTLAAALDAWGFSVDERAVDDPALRVRVWDDWLYDKLLVVPGGKGEEGGGEGSRRETKNSMDAGGRVLFARGFAGPAAQQLAM